MYIYIYYKMTYFENRQIKDCIYFSNFSYLLLKEYKKTYVGNDFKYLSIKKDTWGNEGEDFHQVITFKYKNVWYYLDRYDCDIQENINYGKKIGLADWENQFSLVRYVNMCGFKNEVEHQNNIRDVVNEHLFKITGIKY